MAETVGSLIDKLTIVGLKIYHMEEQVRRPDADPEHRRACRRKARVLKLQGKDLADELAFLATKVLAGKAKLKVYYQFKMYNDPRYRARAAAPEADRSE